LPSVMSSVQSFR